MTDAKTDLWEDCTKTNCPDCTVYDLVDAMLHRNHDEIPVAILRPFRVLNILYYKDIMEAYIRKDITFKELLAMSGCSGVYKNVTDLEIREMLVEPQSFWFEKDSKKLFLKENQSICINPGKLPDVFVRLD